MTQLLYARRGFHYNNYKFYLDDRFGERVQRVSIEGGFTCPNRDGSKGVGGCIYCNPDSFSPPYSDRIFSIQKQIKEGTRFLNGRFRADKFIAYFQNYTNTYAPLNKLEKMYREALDHPKVVGLSVSTRPDCIDENILALLKDISADYDVNLEFGLESLKDESLIWMNRCHDVKTSLKALEITDKIFLGFNLFLTIVGTMTLIIAGVGVANIMHVVVRERTKEIGIKRAIGAKKIHIMFQFIFESLLISITGGTTGIFLAKGIIFLIWKIPAQDEVSQLLFRPILSNNVVFVTVIILTLGDHYG